jgi:ketosteroid isomerase-like protein
MDDEKELHRLNLLFYRCLETLDMACMESIWLREDWVRSVHPGWDVLVGWDAIRGSWERIFASTAWIRITPTDVKIHVLGDSAVVACTENITTADGDQLGVAVAAAQATSVFVRTPEGWRLVLHHASPAPMLVTHSFSGTVQ